MAGETRNNAAKSELTLKALLENSPLENLSFENGLKLLDELVKGVESGSLPLDQAILSYEKGAKLIEHLRKLLSGAEEKLKVLKVGE